MKREWRVYEENTNSRGRTVQGRLLAIFWDESIVENVWSMKNYYIGVRMTEQ